MEPVFSIKIMVAFMAVNKTHLSKSTLIAELWQPKLGAIMNPDLLT
jgi:hypothetical protein